MVGNTKDYVSPWIKRGMVSCLLTHSHTFIYSRWLIEGNRQQPDSIDITNEEEQEEEDTSAHRREPSDEQQQQQQPVAGQAAE